MTKFQISALALNLNAEFEADGFCDAARFRRAKFCSTAILDARFRRAIFCGVKFCSVRTLCCAQPCCPKLCRAKPCGLEFCRAEFRGIKFKGAEFKSVKFRGAGILPDKILSGNASAKVKTARKAERKFNTKRRRLNLKIDTHFCGANFKIDANLRE